MAKTCGVVEVSRLHATARRFSCPTARTVKNRRLAATGYMWAFAALSSAEPRTQYDRRRDDGERHSAAPRNLFNKLLGCLYHCLQERPLALVA